MTIATVTAALERRQVSLAVAAMAVGAAAGLTLPFAPELEHAVNPVLAALLFVTFVAVPLSDIGRALADRRFVAWVLGLNFVVVPVVAIVLSRWVAADTAALIGVLLVLLTPCVDYVITFAGAAGGNRAALLAVTPILLVAQLLLLPPLLLLAAGSDAGGLVEPGPFVGAFLGVVVAPLLAAVIAQLAAARRAGVRRVVDAAGVSMVPLLMLTLAIVIASQLPAVLGSLERLVPVAILFVAFGVIMTAIGVLAARIGNLDAARGRALTFSGVTRNSLVVLPLALALPAELALAPLVVVTQTLVELVLMVVLVRLLPRLLPART